MKKWAIITGCAKGIGKKTALSLARDGYNIIGTYNTSEVLIKDLEKKLNNIGIEYKFYKVDLSIETEINCFVNAVLKLTTQIDILVNNAALSLDCEFIDITKEQFLKILDVNLVAPFLLAKKLYSSLANGVIINIASTDGINTYTEYNIDYSASKAGLINLTKSLAMVLKDVRVYAICPNWVNTESIQEMNQDYLKEELKRVGQSNLIEPESIADEVINLVESNKKSGSIIVMEA